MFLHCSRRRVTHTRLEDLSTPGGLVPLSSPVIAQLLLIFYPRMNTRRREGMEALTFSQTDIKTNQQPCSRVMQTCGRPAWSKRKKCFTTALFKGDSMNKSKRLVGQGKRLAGWNDSWHKGTSENNAPPPPHILAVELLYISSIDSFFFFHF